MKAEAEGSQYIVKMNVSDAQLISRVLMFLPGRVSDTALEDLVAAGRSELESLAFRFSDELRLARRSQIFRQLEDSGLLRSDRARIDSVSDLAGLIALFKRSAEKRYASISAGRLQEDVRESAAIGELLRKMSTFSRFEAELQCLFDDGSIAVRFALADLWDGVDSSAATHLLREIEDGSDPRLAISARISQARRSHNK